MSLTNCNFEQTLNNIHMKILVRNCILLCFVLASACYAEPMNANKKTKSVSALQVKGTSLYDENGKPIQLKGVSLGWHNWWPQYYNAGVVKTLKDDWGGNVVRASMGIEPDNGYLESPMNSKMAVKRVVDAAIANDMYAIIDWHCHNLRLDEAKEFFTEMANDYHSYDNVIYELYNEPVNDSWTEIKDYSEELIQTIRKIDDDAIILVAAPRWAQNLDEVADNPIKGYDNIMYTLHFYAATHKDDLRSKATYALGKGIPVFVSECAAMEASGDGPIDVESWEQWQALIDKHQLSSVMWSISNTVETCSMLVENAPTNGSWSDTDLKPWGQMVKAYLSGENFELPAPTASTAILKIDKPDHLVFETGEQAHISLKASSDGISSGEVTLIVEKDTHETIGEYKKEYDLSRSSTQLDFPLDLAPGFYRVKINHKDTLFDEFNIGIEPQKIVSPTDAQPDFVQFWEDGKEQLAQIAPEYEMTLLPEESTEYRELYLVKMKSLDQVEITGYLAIPTDKTKKYPTFINYMGYGSKPWKPGTNYESETIDFVLSTRGQGINEPTNIYGDWITFHLDDKESYYYRGAFMDLVRGVDFLVSLEQCDQDNLFAEGGSQGGAFTLVACALDPRIKAAAPTVPFLSDFPDYFKIAQWPSTPVIAAQQQLGLSDEEMYRNLSYFDVKNFAPYISCPIIMAVGLQDDVCPPHTNFSGYNLIASEKSYHIFPHMGHSVVMEQWQPMRDAFFAKNMKKQ